MSAISTGLKNKLIGNAQLTEKALKEYLDKETPGFEVLKESMTYSVMAGGKRIRPFLVIEFCTMFGGDIDSAIPFAAAIEMIHSSSLIHDDLPCMDNDDLRRGKPTNHKVFGEANALLAGDALLLYAFSVAASNKRVSDRDIISAVKTLSDCAGYLGMVGGQVLDLIGEENKYGMDTLKYMQSLKTGKLLEASCLLGCYAAGVTDEGKLEAAKKFAGKTGLCFQLVDDVLDVIGDEAVLGKPIGSDKENDKNTFMSFYTVDEAMAYASQLTEEAKAAISGFDGSETLCELCDYLLTRKN